MEEDSAARRLPGTPPGDVVAGGDRRPRVQDIRWWMWVLVAVDYVSLVATAVAEGALDPPGAPPRWRVPAAVALASAAYAALVWFVRRLPAHGCLDARRRRMKRAAQIMASTIAVAIGFVSPFMAMGFIWLF